MLEELSFGINGDVLQIRRKGDNPQGNFLVRETWIAQEWLENATFI